MKGNIRHLKKIHFSTSFAGIEAKLKEWRSDRFHDLGIYLIQVFGKGVYFRGKQIYFF